MISIMLIPFKVFSANKKLFCSGDGIRSSLFYSDGRNSYEFVDIQFSGPKHLESYLACTNYLFLIQNKDRFRKIKYVALLNSANKSLVRFADSEKALFYKLCLKDINCEVKFPYSLLEPKIFLKQLTSKKQPLDCDDSRPITQPTPIEMSSELQKIEFWELPKEDLVKQFWKISNQGQYNKIIISTMTFSLSFLKDLIRKFGETETNIYLLTSFNIMSMDDGLLRIISKLPKNIHLIPIYQSSQEPYSHHQKGAIFLSSKKPIVIWNSANFRRFETRQLFDLGITVSDQQFADALLTRWMTTAEKSCNEVKYRDCSLRLRYSSSPPSEAIWQAVTKKGCDELPAFSSTKLDSPKAMGLVLALISSAKKSIHVHSHIFGNSLILAELKKAQANGLDVKVVVGKSGKNFNLPWVKTIKLVREHHAKFLVIDDTTFFWGTGNMTKTSFNNQREDFFYGKSPQIISKLKDYFEKSWSKAK
jgi:hypothetical protein